MLHTLRLAFLVAVALSSDLAGQSAPSAESMIRAARAGFNRAIAAHDTAAISTFLSPDYHSVSSRNSQSNGRDEDRASWVQMFASRPRLIFVRTPRTVTVNSHWGQAGESGRWTGQWLHHDSLTKVGGEYYAKWTKVDGRWLILAETFVQTTCSGSSYCDVPPPPASRPSP